MGPSNREDARTPAGASAAGNGQGRPELDAARRKRAAIETYSRHEATLRRTARRYSICADDADDALQRALEILLRKAPSEDQRELIKWTQTVVKHEALAVRRERERILAGPAARPPEPDADDWVALIPSRADGPPERAERREAVSRSREALQALKPQELRALTLLAEGYSYREIGEITGFSATKINRCLAEGRERFRHFVSRSEGGELCAEMRPLLSAYCDGEVSAEQETQVREHLRACGQCRATMRAYRAAPAAAAALAPALPVGRSLLDRAHDAVAGLAARFSGGGASDSALTQIATAGGTRGAGMAALAKLAAVCVGTVSGAAACVATGVVPAPLDLAANDSSPSRIERTTTQADEETSIPAAVEYEPALAPTEPETSQETAKPKQEKDPEPVEPTPIPEAASGAVEYTPPAETAPPPASTSGGSSGSAAGEFGP
ncbi:MAG TPA: sigma-70 family RNA polymerase sigma factor [Solirubrobacterales bacterium]|nr:sigma-70 family RNA polymerase sigma factor [Solirubrobacterales bacterium]